MINPAKRALLLWTAAICLLSPVSSRANDLIHTFNIFAGGLFPQSTPVLHRPLEPGAQAPWVLYGVLNAGGDNSGAAASGSEGSGCGLIYELLPPAAGNRNWTERRSYLFRNEGDGCNPTGTIAFDRQGHLFGTFSRNAGATATGSGVYMATPPGVGGYFWQEKVIYFGRVSTVQTDQFGNVYATTPTELDQSGQPVTQGAIVKLTPVEGATGYAATTIYRFLDGSGPTGTISFDESGAIYGVQSPGVSSDGLFPQSSRICRLSLPDDPRGSWSYAALHDFAGAESVQGTLLLDPAHHVYGVNQEFAAYGNCLASSG